ncbi:MAG: EAL domain-containing protein [Steroidobacteraceae bacterium]|jgi:EAL domain-containing protein (putative c-di-GMP-specific phosphodiesterase class I)|nr:EAL domain-containing protein [Steroidobacteraceae bacterium]
MHASTTLARPGLVPMHADWPSITTAFQPIVEASTGRIHAYEALVRGRDGTDAGAVLAAIPEPDRAAFDQHCRDVAVREAAALRPDAPLGFNVRYVDSASCLAAVRATLARALQAGLGCEHLSFEITEAARIVDPAALHAAAHRRGAEWRLLLDDFGTGRSGLALLEQLRPDGVKLDRVLVHGIADSAPGRAVVRRVVEVAGALGVEVIAKGVERRQDLDALRDLGIALFQGYLFAPPQVGRLS